MARKKKDVLKEIEDVMNEARYRIVRTTTGQLCLARPTPSGTSITATEYNQSDAQVHVSRLLIEEDIEANHADIDSVLTVLRSKANDADPVRVYNRVAETTDGVIYLDLADATKRVTEIRPDGWRESVNCPVPFNRPPSALPIPFPVQGEQISLLRCVLGIENDDLWWLVLGFVLSCFKERAAHFVAVIEGPTGAGKSLLTRYLGRVLDHRNPQTPRIPMTRKDIMAVGAHRYVLTFDNMTPLTPQQSGDLCAIATGSGLEGRELYRNFGSSGAEVQRPMILNGIRGLLAREEVRSRAIPILLTERTPESRRTDESIEDEFLRHWPAILGALCDLAVSGLKYRHSVCDPSQQVRMMSSATWVERCLQGAGLGGGLFLNALERARTAACVDVSEGWSLFPYLQDMAEASIEGLAKDLWEPINKGTHGRPVPADWPRSLEAFGSQLQEHAEGLREAGILFTKQKTKKGMYYCFRLASDAASLAPSAPEPADPSGIVPEQSSQTERGQREQCETISKEEYDHLATQFATKANETQKQNPNALVYLALPNRTPILCGRSAVRASELLGRQAEKYLLPVTPEELDRCRVELGGLEVIPLKL